MWTPSSLSARSRGCLNDWPYSLRAVYLCLRSLVHSCKILFGIVKYSGPLAQRIFPPRVLRICISQKERDDNLGTRSTEDTLAASMLEILANHARFNPLPGCLTLVGPFQAWNGHATTRLWGPFQGLGQLRCAALTIPHMLRGHVRSMKAQTVARGLDKRVATGHLADSPPPLVSLLQLVQPYFLTSPNIIYTT